MPSTDGEVAVNQAREIVTVTVTYDRARRPAIPVLPVGARLCLRVGPIPAGDLGFGAAESQAPKGMYVASADIEMDRAAVGPHHAFLNLRGYYLG